MPKKSMIAVLSAMVLCMLAGLALVVVVGPLVSAESTNVIINGIEYQTVYIKGDSDIEQSKIMFRGNNETNYRYVLMDNWNLVQAKTGLGYTGTVTGKHIIFDLNGHTITMDGAAETGCYLYTSDYLVSLEFTDTSPQGGGWGFVCTHSPRLERVVFSGNSSYHLEVTTNRTGAFDAIVRAGRNVRVDDDFKAIQKINFVVAPYMNLTSEDTQRVSYAASHTTYAVAESHQGAGAYDDEVSYKRDLTVGELANLDVPTDKTYYLWGKNDDGEYEFLRIVSQNGEWIRALEVDAPTADTGEFVYDGTEQTYNPYGFDDATMTMEGNTQTNAGTHKVKVSLKSPITVFADSGRSYVEFDFAIANAKLTVAGDGDEIDLATQQGDFTITFGADNVTTVDGCDVVITFDATLYADTTAEPHYTTTTTPVIKYANMAAGTYYVYYQITADNHNTLTGVWTVTITGEKPQPERPDPEAPEDPAKPDPTEPDDNNGVTHPDDTETADPQVMAWWEQATYIGLCVLGLLLVVIFIYCMSKIAILEHAYRKMVKAIKRNTKA